MVPSPRAAVCPDRLRSLNLPQPVHVMFADTNDRDIPVAVSQEASWKRIESVGEIWRIDDEWWRDRISRRYIDVVLQGGKHVALYEDLLTKHWYVQTI